MTGGLVAKWSQKAPTQASLSRRSSGWSFIYFVRRLPVRLASILTMALEVWLQTHSW
jgi:hypothetical protein